MKFPAEPFLINVVEPLRLESITEAPVGTPTPAR